MNIWVTRAEPGASRTAERLRGLGHTPLIAPVLEILTLAPRIDLGDVGALAFTSANGVRAFAALVADRGLLVFAVGEATAQAARAAGFGRSVSAEGDVEALAALIAAHGERLAGRVLFAGAAEPAGDLLGALATAGVAARAVAVYETRALAAEVPPGAQAMLVHSPRAAAALAKAGLAGLVAYCISEAAAAPLAGSGARLAVATQPNEADLLALLGP